MSSRRFLLLATVATVVATVGCARSTELLEPFVAECSAPSFAVHLGGSDDAHCAGALASQFGRYALCSCDDLIVTADLFVGRLGGPGPPPNRGSMPPPPPGPSNNPADIGPDGGGMSTDGPSSALGPPGAVGVNGDVNVWEHAILDGSMIVGGNGGVKLNSGNIRANLRSDGSIASLAPTWVEGDMFASGKVTGPFRIDGTLHLPDGATIAPEVIAPSVVREAVSFPSPCGCGNGPLFDVAAVVAERRTRNANARLPAADAFASEITTNQTFDFPCGEFYFAGGIRTLSGASLELRVHGHTGIFVDGDVRLASNLTVTLDEGAELDLVVAGSFHTTGRVFGAPGTPARLRLWVGSTTIELQDQIQFGATVYAPSAVFSAGVGLSMYGSYFVQTMAAVDDVNLFYDGNAASSGEACGVAPSPPVE